MARPIKRPGTIEVYFSHGEWRWRLTASNGKTVLQGEGHADRSHVGRAVRAAQALFPVSAILELPVFQQVGPKSERHPVAAAALAVTKTRRGRKRGPGRPKKRGPGRPRKVAI